jgi:hypothetical protein
MANIRPRTWEEGRPPKGGVVVNTGWSIKVQRPEQVVGCYFTEV